MSSDNQGPDNQGTTVLLPNSNIIQAQDEIICMLMSQAYYLNCMCKNLLES